MGMAVEYSASGCVLLALLCLLLPLNWFFSALLAAAVHELCHIMAVKIVGGSIYRLRIEPCGAVLETDPMEQWKALFCILAGPVGSLSLLLFFRWIPRIALCGMVQGCFNLLPIFPLDGGRLIRCFAEMVFPENIADNFCVVGEWFSAMILFGTGIYGSFVLHLGMMPMFTALFFIGRLLCGKISCKEDKVRVQ